MTLLGKIFTVMIFIMSILFMAFTVALFATHKNWKMKVMNPTASEQYELGLVYQLKNARDQNLELRAELEDLRNQKAIEQAARRHALGALESKLDVVRTQLAEKESALRQLLSTEEVSSQALKVALDNVEALRNAVVVLRDEVRDTQSDRDLQFDKVVKLTDDLQGAVGTTRVLQERAKELIEQLSTYERVIQAARIDIHLDTNAVPPELDGIVTAVSQGDLIEISLGSDDGLREGHQLIVYRDNNYLGRAMIVKTSPDKAVARVDEKTKRGMIEVRDRVTTKLSTRTG